MSKKIIIILLIIIGAVSIIWLTRPSVKSQAWVSIGNNQLKVFIAKTEAQRQQGLSGQLSLAPEQGMLFIFPEKTLPSFWMKDMKFPLDFIWISYGKIVEIAQNIEPPPANKPNNLPTYQPSQPVNWVIEVNAGWVAKHGVKVGDTVKTVDY